MGETALFVGGIRSGKSGYAQKWAEKRGEDCCFLATLRVEDPEMQKRVLRHQRARGEKWRVLELQEDVPAALRSLLKDPPDVLLLDCVSTWIADRLERESDEAIVKEVLCVAEMFQEIPFPIGFVTTDVSSSLVPASPLGRRFQDMMGEVNQILAGRVENVILFFCGLPLIMKEGGKILEKGSAETLSLFD